MKKVIKYLSIGLSLITLSGCELFPFGDSSSSTQPSSEPTSMPTSDPTSEPTLLPTSEPTTFPTSEHTSEPTSEVTSIPTSEPSSEPTSIPTSIPTLEPTSISTSDPTSEASSASIEPVEKSCLFHLSGNYLPFSNYGINIDDEGQSGNRDKLFDAINEEVGDGIFKSLSIKSSTIATDDGSSEQNHLHFSLGTGALGGEFSLTMADGYSISKFIIKCSAYYKTYTGGVSVDLLSMFKIGSETYNLEAVAGQAQEIKTFEKEYTSPIKSLTLYNSEGKQRVFFESIEIFYVN